MTRRLEWWLAFSLVIAAALGMYFLTFKVLDAHIRHVARELIREELGR